MSELRSIDIGEGMEALIRLEGIVYEAMARSGKAQGRADDAARRVIRLEYKLAKAEASIRYLKARYRAEIKARGIAKGIMEKLNILKAERRR